MTNTSPDWQEIHRSLEHLRASRNKVRELCLDELESIEATIHHVNKKLDGFAFSLHSYPDEDEVAYMAYIELRDLAEEDPYPWTYRVNFYFAGHFDCYLAQEISDETHLKMMERSQRKIGERNVAFWEYALSSVALFNLRDTPRQSELI